MRSISLIRATFAAAATFGACLSAAHADVFAEFTTFNPATANSPSEGWVTNPVLGTPADSFNTSTSEIGCSCGTVVTEPLQAGFHPGPNNEMASYEFVAPQSGDYQLSALFSGRDYVFPTDTQVSIVDGYGTTPIFVGVVDGYAGSAIDASGQNNPIAAFGPSPTVSFADTLQLSQGDQLYFNVAWDPNGTRPTGPWLGDSTAIAATLASNGSTYDLASQFSNTQGPIWYYGVYNGSSVVPVIPEPSTWLLMALGFVGLGVAAHRQRARTSGAV